MRIFLAILVFAISFSGYSAAAHAFSDELCASEAQAEMTLNADCADHHGGADSQQDTENSDTKSVCVDCLHCCASHGASLQPVSIRFNPVPMTLSAALTPTLTGDYLFSLLRPPKNLV